ncbi:MAG: NTP transferase domain-containing protein [Clostridia bacterium]|nr:NTP transferase domain-containing protein [Clostridia bacterium]
MKALILNSGVGRRMGVLTSEHPKCMTDISAHDTILSRQLRLLSEAGVEEVIMTTGLFNDILVDYCHSLQLPLRYTFVYNPDYASTNYIQSIYCARELLHNEDILLLHGDLVFEKEALKQALSHPDSCVTVSSTLPLPLKDFKAVIEGGCVRKVGIEFFEHAMACQPLYKLLARDWNKWLDSIIRFCEDGVNTCYAENALNEISADICIRPLDVKDMLCNEIDTPEDLAFMSMRVREVERLGK